MKKQINDLLLKMQTGENCIGETANALLNLSSIDSSAYMVKVEGKGTMIILAESISDACDKLESKGYKKYAFTKSTSLDVVF